MQQYAGLNPGSVIGPFRIVGKIAEGGMGEIYQGHDDELNRAVAIKILLPEALREADGLSRFQGEAKALARIDHANVVRVIVSGESDGLYFMALEFIEGLQLEVYLVRHSPTLTELLDIFTQMVEGLQAAHDLDIVHRDIKPQNIMVTAKGKVKLVDFGVAKAQTAHDNFKTTVGVVVGTRSFLAPEIMKGAPATKQGDIYSLGLILKFMLTGEMPGTEAANRVKLNLLLPQSLVKLLTSMTQANVNTRFTDLKDVLKELKQISFKNLPAELLTPIPGNGRIANLEKHLNTCRERGQDMIDSRMAINLAAKPGMAAPMADNGKTQVMNLKAPQELQVTDDALSKGIARVQKTKALVLTGGIRQTAAAPAAGGTPIPGAPAGGPPAQIHTQKPQGDTPPYFKIGFVMIMMFLAFRAFIAYSTTGDAFSIFRGIASALLNNH